METVAVVRVSVGYKNGRFLGAGVEGSFKYFAQTSDILR